MKSFVIEEKHEGGKMYLAIDTHPIIPDVYQETDVDKAVKFYDELSAKQFMKFLSYQSWFDTEKMGVVEHAARKRRKKSILG